MGRDIAALIGAVDRQLTSEQRNGKQAWVLVASRTYAASMDDLWDALTNPERIPRWFAPVSGDLRLGGRYQIEGNASGEITACEPPEHFALTWGMQGDPSWVDVCLANDGKGDTRLRLEHVAHVPPEFWDQFGPGAVGVGWDQALFGLDQHFATGETVNPEQSLEWVASAEGRLFIEQSSERWCEASIGAGTPANAARAAAARTTAFYTGVSPP